MRNPGFSSVCAQIQAYFSNLLANKPRSDYLVFIN